MLLAVGGPWTGSQGSPTRREHRTTTTTQQLNGPVDKQLEIKWQNQRSKTEMNIVTFVVDK